MLPTSDSWLLCHVNVTPAIENYWDNISPNTRLITDFTAFYTAPDNSNQDPSRDVAMANYLETLAEIHTRFPNILVGTYKSARDAEWDRYVFTYPRRSVARAPIAEANIIGHTGPHGDIYDYRKKEVRDFAMPRLVNDVVNTGAPVVFLDNVSHPSAGWLIDWVTTMDVVKEITTKVQHVGRSVIVNCAWAFVVPENEASIQEFLKSGADGVSLEMSYLATTRNSVDATKLAVNQYRELLDAGKTVVFISCGDLPRTNNDELKKDAEVLAALAMMVRKPGDRLWVAYPFWLSAAPEWAAYPATLGPATGDLNVVLNSSNQVVLTRAFTHGLLTLNAATLVVTVVPV